MRKLWHLMLAGRIIPNVHRADLFDAHSNYLYINLNFKRYGLTVGIKTLIRDALTPYISLSSIRDLKAQDIARIFTTNICLSSYSHQNIITLMNEKNWRDALPKLLLEFDDLLIDTLDLMQEFSNFDIIKYSIIDSKQDHLNITSYPLPLLNLLVTLNRNAFCATAEINPEKALWVAEKWIKTPHPIFKKLAFFSATQIDIIPTETGLKWLLSDNHYWLWHTTYKREIMRLITPQS